MKQEAEVNAESDRLAKDRVEKLNAADSMLFQTEKQLKEFGEKLSDDKKAPIETALENLRKAHASQEISAIDAAMEQINEAWKNASEELYKAQAEAGAAGEQDVHRNIMPGRTAEADVTARPVVTVRRSTWPAGGGR